MTDQETLSEAELVERLRVAVNNAGGQMAFSRRHGISNTYVHHVLAGNYRLGPKIAHALGYEKVKRFQKLP